MLFNLDHCGLTERGVIQIAEIDQLEELELGNPSEYPDEPDAKTELAFITILKKMRNLKELKMR